MDPCWRVRATQGRGTCRLRPDRRPRPRRCRLAWLAAQGALWGPGNRRANPTDRAKLGWKWSVASERHGVPVGWAVDGANRNDVAMLEPVRHALIRRCPCHRHHYAGQLGAPEAHVCRHSRGPAGHGTHPAGRCVGAVRRAVELDPVCVRATTGCTRSRRSGTIPRPRRRLTQAAAHRGIGWEQFPRAVHLRTARWSAASRASASLCAFRPFDTHEANMNMNAASEFAQSIAEAARSVNQPRTLDDTLQTIVEVACNSVPGFDQVGISTLQREGTVKTRECIGALVQRLDEIQYGLGEGPCAEALRGIDVVSVSSLRDEQRWPHYVPQARAMGVRSQLAVKLYLDQGTLGGINFYSTVSDDVSPDVEALARLFATHSAIALGLARERANLNEALQSRKMIGQAIGIIMERYDMNEDRAFAFLVRASSHANIKLRAIAQELVDQHNAS